MPIVLEKKKVGTAMTREDAMLIERLLGDLRYLEGCESKAAARCSLFNDDEREWVREEYRVDHECIKSEVACARAKLDAELAKWRIA